MNTIGIVAPFSLTSAASGVTGGIYYKDLVLACASAANDAGLNAMLLSEDNDRAITLADLTDRRCDAVVLVVKTGADEFVAAAESAGLPCVTVGRDFGAWQVHTDNRLGARLAVEHLLDRGHTDLAFAWYGKPTVPSASQRRDGFEDAARDAGARFRFYSHGELPALIDSVARGNGPTGVFCYNDEIAVDILDAARAGGVDVPENLSVVGFDDNILA